MKSGQYYAFSNIMIRKFVINDNNYIVYSFNKRNKEKQTYEGMLCGTIPTHPGEYNLTFDPPPTQGGGKEINNQRSEFKTYQGKGGIKREEKKKNG